MGHVPPRPVLEDGEGPDLPRRQHRGSRSAGAPDLGGPAGSLGERLAREFLKRHGIDVLAVNHRVGRGEVDIIAADHGARIVVEVRSITGSYHPLDAIGPEKRDRVRHLASVIGVARCDLVGVGLHGSHYVVHWAPNGA